MSLNTAAGSKVRISYVAETTPGTTPATPTTKIARVKAGSKFELKRDTFASKEIRTDRQIPSLTYGNKSGSGSLPIEWGYGSFDDFLEAVMGGTWASHVLKVGNTERTFTFEDYSPDVGLVGLDTGVQFTGFSLNNKTNAIVEGEFTFLSRNQRVAQTSGVNLAIDATAKTITRASAGFMTVDGWVNGDTVTMTGNTDAGNNGAAWLITDLTDTVMTFTTMTGAVTKTSTSGIVANLAPICASPTAASVVAPFDSFTGGIYEGGTQIAHVTGFDLKFDQAGTPNFAIGSDSAQSVTMGTVNVTGTLTIYYINNSVRKKFLNGTESTLKLVLGNGTTQSLTFEMGSAKYTSNTRDFPEGARMETCNFQATYNTGDASTIKITRTAT